MSDSEGTSDEAGTRFNKGTEIAPLPGVDYQLYPPSRDPPLAEFRAAHPAPVPAGLGGAQLAARLGWSQELARTQAAELARLEAELRAEWVAKEAALSRLCEQMLGHDV